MSIGIYTKPQQPPKPEPEPAPKKVDPPASEVSLDDLMDKGMLVLYREMRELLGESAFGMLKKDSQAALVNYIRLFKDLRKDEKGAAGKLSDEELEKLAK